MTEGTDKARVLQTVFEILLNESPPDDAKAKITANYPFAAVVRKNRAYSETIKTRVFLQDGFIDRYTGQRLVFIGALRLMSLLIPDVFPYHPNWKMDSCHIAYWELAPTLDHVMPIARGGADEPKNWVTTSMLSNVRKANWTLDELGWPLLPGGSLAEWDGLIGYFMRYVEADPVLMNNHKFIRTCYKAADAAMRTLDSG